MLRLFLSLIILFIMLPLAAQAQYTCPPCNSGCDTLQWKQAGSCPHCGMTLQAASTTANEAEQAPLRIAFYLQDGVEVLDFAGPMEVFAYAGFKVFTVSKTKSPIKSQGILTILPDYSLEDAPQADILAFFGGNADAAASDAAVIEWVQKQRGIQQYFSVCTGAFILGKSGLLDGQTVTTFHQSLVGLKKTVPSARVLRDVRFVDNGQVITTAGISAGIDGALHLVAKLKGPVAAQQVADYMEYDKWSFGEGLLLEATGSQKGEEAQLTAKQALLTYEGVYRYKEGQEAFLVYSSEKERLYAVLGEERIPLYFESAGVLRNSRNDLVLVEFDASGTLSGLREGPGGPFYPRISSQVPAAVRERLAPGREVK